VRVVELEQVGPEVWSAVLAGEENVWGPGEDLAWVPKQRHVGVLDDDNVPLALAGAVIVRVAVGGEQFPVAGVGSVIVTRSMRGRGLARLVIEEILRVCAELGPDRAMLFCREELTGLYGRFGFREIEASVSAEQPGGRITMPMRAMWAPLIEGAGWPAGAVAVQGEPF